MRPRTQILGVAVVGGAVSALVAVANPVHYAYHEPELHIVIATAGALIAAMAALLVVGRFRRSGSLDDLLLATALALYAGASMAFGVVPSASGQDPIDDKWVWAASSIRTAGVVLFAAAATVPDRRLADPRRAAVGLAAVVGALVVVATALFGVFGEALPPSVTPMPETDGAPQLSGHAAHTGLLLLATACFAVAAVGFTRKAERARDPFMVWLATAAVLSAFGRLMFALYPSRYTDWVYVGDAFELLACVSLFVAASWEITRYWRAMSVAAVGEERRRLARDLHDGLAQEIAAINRWAEVGPGGAGKVAAVAERAMQETRLAMLTLSSPLDEPLSSSLVRAAEATASRVDTAVSFDLDDEATAPVAVRDALTRLTCDAIADAALHRSAHSVRVELAAAGSLMLRVVDDGMTHPSDDDVRSLQRRAEGVGASLHVACAPGQGAAVEVHVP